MKKKTASLMQQEVRDGHNFIPLNRRARRAMAKRSGIDWEKAKNFKKNRPLVHTDMGLAYEEDIVEI